MWRGNNNPFCSWISENRSHKTKGVLFLTKDIIVLVASPSDKIQLNSSVRKEDLHMDNKKKREFIISLPGKQNKKKNQKKGR
jgi:hypothetical protein